MEGYSSNKAGSPSSNPPPAVQPSALPRLLCAGRGKPAPSHRESVTIIHSWICGHHLVVPHASPLMRICCRQDVSRTVGSVTLRAGGALQRVPLPLLETTEPPLGLSRSVIASLPFGAGGPRSPAPMFFFLPLQVAGAVGVAAVEPWKHKGWPGSPPSYGGSFSEDGPAPVFLPPHSSVPPYLHPPVPLQTGQAPVLIATPTWAMLGLGSKRISPKKRPGRSVGRSTVPP